VERLEFLKSVLSSEGHYCLFATNGERRTQNFYDTIDELHAAVDTFDAKDHDVYFALSTFVNNTNRRADNALHLQSFFVDLDCGPSKEYPSQQDALSALQAFCTKTSMPEPTKVNSGRGIHAYWVLSAPVPVDDWVPVAERFKEFCEENGLKADPAVTADAARILRMPDTRNFKDTPPSPVALISAEPSIELADFVSLLGGVTPVNTASVGGNVVSGFIAVNAENSFGRIVKKIQIGKGCAQLAHILTDQANVTEPLWRAGLSIAKFCEDGDRAAQVMSRGHPDYNSGETHQKMSLVKGPYTCRTFNGLRPDVCMECALWGKIKSPIVLGKQFKEADEADNEVVAPSAKRPASAPKIYNIPTYPKPYFRGAKGGVYKRTSNSDGEIEEECIYHNDIYIMRRIWDTEIGQALVFRLHMPRDGVREWTMPMSSITSRDEFRKAMSTQGVAAFGAKLDKIQVYIMAWIEELQFTQAEDEAHKQFGWVDDSMTAFILGDRVIYGNDEDYNPPSTQTASMIDYFTPKGTEQGYLDAIDFYNRDGFELHQFTIAASYASILMPLTGIGSAGLHMYGDTGVGKTTMLMAGLSAWGNPEELLLEEQDTYNSKMHRGEIYHNLPLMMDELTNTKGGKLSDLAYQLTGGKQRNRMSQGGNTERHRGKPWSLLAISTGNTSFIEMISRVKGFPKAEAQRILEFRTEAKFFGSASKAETDKLWPALKGNYGHAGVRFVQWVINNRVECERTIKHVQSRVDEKAELGPENRFWSAAVTAIISALMIGRKAGVLPFEVKPVFTFAVNRLRERRAYVADMGSSVTETLNNYISEHWSNILWIKSTDDGRGDIDSNPLDMLALPEVTPRGKFVARYETDVKKVYLLPKPLKTWCIDQQINYEQLVRDLTEKMKAKKVSIRLSKGTHMNLPVARVICVDFSIDGVPDGSEGDED